MNELYVSFSNLDKTLCNSHPIASYPYLGCFYCINIYVYVYTYVYVYVYVYVYMIVHIENDSHFGRYFISGKIDAFQFYTQILDFFLQ